MTEIQRLESILASSFWGEDKRQCVLEEVTFEITGHEGDYRWRFVDRRDGAYAKSTKSLSSFQLAKDDMRKVLEAGLNRHREKSSNQS